MKISPIALNHNKIQLNKSQQNEAVSVHKNSDRLPHYYNDLAFKGIFDDPCCTKKAMSTPNENGNNSLLKAILDMDFIGQKKIIAEAKRQGWMPILMTFKNPEGKTAADVAVELEDKRAIDILKDGLPRFLRCSTMSADDKFKVLNSCEKLFETQEYASIALSIYPD